MIKDEGMTKTQMTNDEKTALAGARLFSGFVIRGLIRHSSFGFRHFGTS
jgi:hypothetical protein